MTGTDLCVDKSQSVPVIFEPPCISTIGKGIIVTIPWKQYASALDYCFICTLDVLLALLMVLAHF
jgi:hypothetical protein